VGSCGLHGLGISGGPYEHGNKPSGSIRGKEFLAQLSDC
jgi:hypothetical protein